jgi:hypothetical protein
LLQTLTEKLHETLKARDKAWDKQIEKTKKVLLQTLTEKLHETLKARDKAWDKQIEEDIKAGKLDHLREKTLEDIHAGRFTYL